MSYLLKILYLLVFGLMVILTYYYAFPFHKESFDGYAGYAFFIVLFYLCYKGYQYFFPEEKISFSPIGIFGLFLGQLFILSIIFFQLNGIGGGNGVGMFFKMLGFLFLPLCITLISISTGKKILSYVKDIKSESSIFQFLVSLGLGFTVFVTALTILGFLGFYNVLTFAIVFLGLTALSYKELIDLVKSSYEYQIEIDKKAVFQTLTAEFFFLVITFLISVNLINALRPMPIGWDDLGVYMNFPQLLAQAGEIIPLGGMFAWQVFTGIGYMFQSPTQAFYLNNLGGILSVLVIVLSFLDLLKSRLKTYIHLPLLAGMMFLSMPMIIFQQAKDMKLDPGLFFITAIAVYMMLYLFLKYLGYRETYKTPSGEVTQDISPNGATLEIHVETKKNNSFLEYFSKHEHIGVRDMFDDKKYLILVLILGVLAGVAFTIKVTSLLLISGVIGVLFYSKLGIAGLFGYISLYLGIFTKAGLWSMMNVVYPKDDVSFINIVFIGSIVVSGGLFAYSINKYGKKAFQRLLKILGVFLIGLVIAILPWMVNNVIQAKNISVGSILGGKADYLQIDYSKILSEDEKAKIDALYTQNQSISESGTTTNEDWGRYFGYEKGINNYVKLPYNLTMQSNQRGEFTEITFWYLALIPVVILFLSYKYARLAIGTLVFSLAPVLFLSTNPENTIETNKFSQVSTGSIVLVLGENDYIFQDKFLHENIYDINYENYIKDNYVKSLISKSQIEELTKKYIEDLANDVTYNEYKNTTIKTDLEFNRLLSINKEKLFRNYNSYYEENYSNEYKRIQQDLYKKFYSELKNKVKNPNEGQNISSLNIRLSNKDFDYIINLSKIYKSTGIFIQDNIVSFNEVLVKNNIGKNDINLLNQIWKDNRSLSGKVSDLFTSTNLPGGYFILAILFLIPFLYMMYTLDRTKFSMLFKLNAVFAVFYTFLWTISAYGVVWYGIAMYYSFLWIIALGVYGISHYSDEMERKEKTFRIMGSIVVLFIITIYTFNSTFPHGMNNLKNASYLSFKTSSTDKYSSIFDAQMRYYEVLVELNIAEEKREQLLNYIVSKVSSPEINQILETNKISDLLQLNSILTQIAQTQPEANNFALNNAISQARTLRSELYKNILYPTKEMRNTKNIYRIGTFLKYFIADNNVRLLEDSLIYEFDKYFYDEKNLDTSLERMKKVGLDYFLVDLNAATIDRDARRALTKRFESLLLTFTSDKVSLVTTDSMCLTTALEKYKKSFQTSEDLKAYLELAGVNYESYDSEGKLTLTRNQKLEKCYQLILDAYNKKEISETNYPHLISLSNYLTQNPPKSDEELLQIFQQYVSHGWMVLFKIK